MENRRRSRSPREDEHRSRERSRDSHRHESRSKGYEGYEGRGSDRRESRRDRHSRRNDDDRSRRDGHDHRGHHSRRGDERDSHTSSHSRGDHRRDAGDDRTSHKTKDSQRHAESHASTEDSSKPISAKSSVSDDEWEVAEDTGSYYDNFESRQEQLNAQNKLQADKLRQELRGGVAGSATTVSTTESTTTDYVTRDSVTKESGKGPAIDVSIAASVGLGRADDAPITAENMTIQDMLREEMQGRHERIDLKMAQQIAKDGGYINDEDYLSENADRLAQVSQKKKLNLYNQVVGKTKELHDAINNCKLCVEPGASAQTTVISTATQVYMSAAPEPAIAKGTMAIIPMEHRTNSLECSDDEWEEIRNFMKCLAQMWASKNKGVIFYESAVVRSSSAHPCIMAVPVPHHLVNTAPGFFEEAFISGDVEWGTHRKVIDSKKQAKEMTHPKYAFRSSIAKEAPYFHVWFDINGGMGHIVEDTSRWPRGDHFARDVIGGMLRVDPILIRRQADWKSGSEEREYLEQLWKDFDWTQSIEW